jgi:hypothetical protein
VQAARGFGKGLNGSIGERESDEGRMPMATVIKKQMEKGWAAGVPADKVFWCHDGKVITNMAELAAALRDMSEDTYRYHANANKNDFANWLRDVVGDSTLAGQVARAATRAGAAGKVDLRVRSLRASS